MEDDRLCTLVMIGVRPGGTKELIAVEDGYRESAESWKTVLRDLKRRGMHAPVVAVGDGAHFLPLVRDGVAFVDGVQQASNCGKPRARAA